MILQSGVFLATFQVCMPAEDVAGPAFEYRKPEQTVLVVARKPQEIGRVVAKNLDLTPGEVVEVTQQRQIEPGRKVFQGK